MVEGNEMLKLPILYIELNLIILFHSSIKELMLPITHAPIGIGHLFQSDTFTMYWYLQYKLSSTAWLVECM